MINCRYDLPKVRLRFKTDPNGSSPSPPLLYSDKFDPAPSVFLSRLKNGKEIHQAYMRFRNLKKNNYIKHSLSHKKDLSVTLCQRMNTTIARNPEKEHSKLDLALETTFYKQGGQGEAMRRNKFREFLSHKRQLKEQERKEELFVNSKNNTVMMKAKKRQPFQAAISTSAPLKSPIRAELQEITRANEGQRDKNERILRQIKKGKLQMKATRASKSFLIQAWKEDKAFPIPCFSFKSHYQPDDF